MTGDCFFFVFLSSDSCCLPNFLVSTYFHFFCLVCFHLIVYKSLSSSKWLYFRLLSNFIIMFLIFSGESCFLCGVASMFGLPLIIFGALHRQKLREMKGIDGKCIQISTWGYIRNDYFDFFLTNPLFHYRRGQSKKVFLDLGHIEKCLFLHCVQHVSNITF